MQRSCLAVSKSKVRDAQLHHAPEDDVAAWWSRAENLALDILEDLRFWAHGTPIVLSLVTHVTPRFVPLHSRLDGLTLHPVSCRYAVGWTD